MQEFLDALLDTCATASELFGFPEMISDSPPKLIRLTNVNRPTSGVSLQVGSARIANEIRDRLDREAKRRGVTRQALIKMWLVDRIDREA